MTTTTITTTSTQQSTTVVKYPTPSNRPQPAYLSRPTPQELLDIPLILSQRQRREDFSPALHKYNPNDDLEFVRPKVAEKDITTLQELSDACYERYWRGSKGEETATYHVTEFTKFMGGDTKIKTITTTDIDRYTTWCSKTQNNAPATINRKLNTLGRMFSFALDRELITKKPKLERFKTPCGRIRWMTLSEEACMLEFFDAQIAKHSNDEKRHTEWRQFKSLFLFLLYTGCREGEALKLKWKDVADDRIHLWDTKGGATKDRCRTVPLLRHKIGEFVTPKHPTEFVFEEMNKSNIKYRWNMAKKHLGLSEDKEFVPHCLRHTCATRLIQQGVNVLVVKEWLGHSDIKMTMRYAHVNPSQLFDAATKLGVDDSALPF